MPRVRLLRTFSHPVNDSETKVWPAGWSGLVEDDIGAAMAAASCVEGDTGHPATSIRKASAAGARKKAKGDGADGDKPPGAASPATVPRDGGDGQTQLV